MYWSHELGDVLVTCVGGCTDHMSWGMYWSHELGDVLITWVGGCTDHMSWGMYWSHELGDVLITGVGGCTDHNVGGCTDHSDWGWCTLCRTQVWVVTQNKYSFACCDCCQCSRLVSVFLRTGSFNFLFFRTSPNCKPWNVSWSVNENLTCGTSTLCFALIWPIVVDWA